MSEHHHMDMTLIHSDFGSTQGLSDELAKQLGMVLQRSLLTIPQDPIFPVSVVRIMGREEKLIGAYLTKKNCKLALFLLRGPRIGRRKCLSSWTES